MCSLSPPPRINRCLFGFVCLQKEPCSSVKPGDALFIRTQLTTRQAVRRPEPRINSHTSSTSTPVQPIFERRAIIPLTHSAAFPLPRKPRVWKCVRACARARISGAEERFHTLILLLLLLCRGERKSVGGVRSSNPSGGPERLGEWTETRCFGTFGRCAHNEPLRSQTS